MMKLKIAVATVVGCMALAACGGNNSDDTMNADANMTDMNAGMTDYNTTTDMNAGTTDINAADGMNATENAMVNDATHNDADTNLSNGM